MSHFILTRMGLAGAIFYKEENLQNLVSVIILANPSQVFLEIYYTF